MRTNALIEALAADAGVKPRRFSRVFAIAIAIGVVAGAGVFLSIFSPRSDLMSVAATSMRYDLKLLAGAALAVAAAFAVSRAARPGASTSGAGLWLLLAPAALVIGAIVELAVVPSSEWGARLIGANARVCMTHIPLIAAVPLGLLLYALRSGAPASPAWAGAMAGLAAGGLAAALYALHCDQDSPLFVATWYVAGVLITTAVGAVLGSRMLRW